MTALLRTTALASILALAAPYAALANEAKTQADSSAQSQSFDAGAAASSDLSGATDAGAGGNVDLMAQFERLRMLDTIGDVEIVKLQAGEIPGAAGAAKAASSAGLEGQPAGSAGSESTSDDLAAGEPGTAADDRISSGFEAGQDATASADASELDNAAEAAAGADTRFQADDQAQLGVGGGSETGAEPDAGALFDEADQSQAGMAPDANAQDLRTAAGSSDWQDAGETASPGATTGAGDLSATFIEDTVSQIPEIASALEEADAEAADIVQVAIGDSGDVTIYVR